MHSPYTHAHALIQIIFIENDILSSRMSRFVWIWDRCYDILNIFAEKISEKIGVFDSKQS
jgi:hypothetical protein